MDIKCYVCEDRGYLILVDEKTKAAYAYYCTECATGESQKYVGKEYCMEPIPDGVDIEQIKINNLFRDRTPKPPPKEIKWEHFNTMNGMGK